MVLQCNAEDDSAAAQKTVNWFVAAPHKLRNACNDLTACAVWLRLSCGRYCDREGECPDRGSQMSRVAVMLFFELDCSCEASTLISQDCNTHWFCNPHAQAMLHLLCQKNVSTMLVRPAGQLVVNTAVSAELTLIFTRNCPANQTPTQCI